MSEESDSKKTVVQRNPIKSTIQLPDGTFGYFHFIYCKEEEDFEYLDQSGETKYCISFKSFYEGTKETTEETKEGTEETKVGRCLAFYNMSENKDYVVPISVQFAENKTKSTIVPQVASVYVFQNKGQNLILNFYVNSEEQGLADFDTSKFLIMDQENSCWKRSNEDAFSTQFSAIIKFQVLKKSQENKYLLVPVIFHIKTVSTGGVFCSDSSPSGYTLCATSQDMVDGFLDEKFILDTSLNQVLELSKSQNQDDDSDYCLCLGVKADAPKGVLVLGVADPPEGQTTEGGQDQTTEYVTEVLLTQDDVSDYVDIDKILTNKFYPGESTEDGTTDGEEGGTSGDGTTDGDLDFGLLYFGNGTDGKKTQRNKDFFNIIYNLYQKISKLKQGEAGFLKVTKSGGSSGEGSEDDHSVGGFKFEITPFATCDGSSSEQEGTQNSNGGS